jgi:hypothetical protein
MYVLSRLRRKQIARHLSELWWRAGKTTRSSREQTGKISSIGRTGI